MIDLPATHWFDTEHYGLLGKPLRKSMSPLMHNANFEAMGMNAAYYPLEFEEDRLAAVMPALSVLGYKGLNVTMPHKKAVIPFMDELDERGARCKAVNTIAIRNGRFVGTNTDGIGFVRGLREQAQYDPASKSCVLFGSGGAGRGISFALLEAGIAHIDLVDMPQSQAMLEELASELNAYRTGTVSPIQTNDARLPALISDADLVVNATCVGMLPDDDAVVFDTDLLKASHMVCDIVYAPPKTKLLRLAEARGCRTLEGYWMLLWQGVEAFTFWTGRQPDVEVMKQVVLKTVNG